MTGQAQTHFSIVIPTYNRAPELDRAIRSVLAQTFESYELIVVDDGSSDGTAAMIRDRFGDQVVLIEAPNRGAGAARNAGIERATGDYIAFLDSDDEALASWLEELSQATGRETGLVTCGCVKRYHDGAEKRVLPRVQGPELEGVRAQFLAGCYAVRATTLRDVGGFVADLAAAQHTELALRLVPALRQRHEAIAVVDQPLVRVNVQSARPSIRANDRAVLAGAEYLLANHEDLLARDPRRLADSHSVAAVRAARLGQYGRALRHFAHAAGADRRSPKRWARLLVSATPMLRTLVWRPRPHRTEA